MSTSEPGERAANDEVAANSAAAEPGLMASIEAMWDDMRALAYDHLQLVALEMRRAALGLVTMVVEGIVMGMLVAASWIAAVAALCLWLIEHGLETSAALLIAAILNLLGALGFGLAIRRKSRVLRLFPATSARLRPDAERSGHTDARDRAA